MDTFNFKNLQLAYSAVYDQNLCESMEELGLIGDYIDEERKEDKIARQQGNPRTQKQKEEKRNKATGLPTSTRTIRHENRRNPYGPNSSYYQDLRKKLALGKYNDKEGNPQYWGHYSRHPKSYSMDLKKYNRYLNHDENIPFKESYESYIAILEHLVQEGYANTLESAEAILENMSEGWMEEILNEGRTEELKNKYTAKYGKPKLGTTQRQHALHSKVQDALVRHYGLEGALGRAPNPAISYIHKQSLGNAEYMAKRSAEEMGGQIIKPKNPNRNK